ncbi:ABC transporter permease [Clostridiaceae bacterium M8S5]|nr:ABC transporter permease [Clostridiaceae bacterium M8S5]
MLKYIIKRLLYLIPILLCVTFLVFVILSFTPGDPARLILGSGAKSYQVEALREELGLNDHLIVQYFRYIGNAITGDFGTSYANNEPVVDLIASRLPNTLKLALLSTLLIVICAIPLGIYSAVKQNCMQDNIIRIASMVLASIPAFWFGLILVLIFSVKLGWLPSTGLESVLAYILPVITMCTAGIAIDTRVTRASMLDVMRQDYIRTAKAKGVKPVKIIRKHAIRNALIPVITSMGIGFAGSFGGSVLIETVFGINGIGRLMVTHIRSKDMPTVFACVILLASVFTIVNLLVDIAYGIIDPRIKTEIKSA